MLFAIIQNRAHKPQARSNVPAGFVSKYLPTHHLMIIRASTRHFTKSQRAHEHAIYDKLLCGGNFSQKSAHQSTSQGEVIFQILDSDGALVGSSALQFCCNGRLDLDRRISNISYAVRMGKRRVHVLLRTVLKRNHRSSLESQVRFFGICETFTQSPLRQEFFMCLGKESTEQRVGWRLIWPFFSASSSRV